MSIPATHSPAPTGLDAFIGAADLALRTLFSPARSERAWAQAVPLAPDTLSAPEKKQVAALMRVNHTGEICAQALYSGQVLATKNESLRTHLAAAGAEEVDHLAWTEERLRDERDDARNALQERTVVDRAKALLMERQGLSEKDAFTKLRKVAMDKGLKLGEVAQRTLDMADLLS